MKKKVVAINDNGCCTTERDCLTDSSKYASAMTDDGWHHFVERDLYKVGDTFKDDTLDREKG